MAEKTETKYILEALWGILPHLYTWGRLQADDNKSLVDLLGHDDIPLILSEKLIAATTGPAPTILGQAGRHPSIDSFLSKIAETAIQPAVRAKAYRSQLDGYITWIEGYQWVRPNDLWSQSRCSPIINQRSISVSRPFIELLKAAATDRSPLVRRVAGNALFTEPDGLRTGVLPIAEMLAEDLSPSVAERGRFALKRLEV